MYFQSQKGAPYSAADRYYALHNVLMKEWQARHILAGYTGFIRDGVVNPHLWFSQSQRILFILKEAYNPPEDAGKSWDLVRDYLAIPKAYSGRIWSAIAEWQYGLERTFAKESPRFDNWLGVKNQNMDDYYAVRHNLLQRCAVINIKKSNGVNSSSNEDLLIYAKDDADLLARQIEIIDPTLIVFGSTFYILNEAHFFENYLESQTYGITPQILAKSQGCFAFGNKKHIIAYYHPANQYPAALNFYGITATYHHFLREREYEDV